MANYINNSGQIRLGWRNSVVQTQSTPTISASLLQSLFGVWNGDTTTNELDKSLFGVWNGDGTPSTTLKTGLFAAYNADDNTNDSFGSNNGTAVGTLTYTTGKIGNAFQFNGSNAYVQLPNSSGQFNFTDNFTINAWISIPNYNVGQSIFVNFSSGGSYGYGIAIYLGTNNTIAFELRNGNSIGQYQTNGGIPTNTFKMITVVREVGQSPKIYFDGVLSSGYYSLGNSSNTPGFQANQNVLLGSFNALSFGNHKQDGTAIWSKALTSTEVTELYNSGNGAYYSSPNFYKLDANDSVSTNHGVLMNGTTFTTGKIGNAFSFDGINDYITLPSSSLRLTDNFTISLWVYYNSLGAGSSLVENYYEPTSMSRWGFALYHQQISGSSRLRFATYAGNTNISEGSTVLSTGTWYHVVVTKSSNNSPKMYVNGLLETFNSQSGNTSINPSYQSQNFPTLGVEYGVGSYYGYLNGRMDSITTWTKALTSDEVTQLYNSGTGAQYPFSSQTLSSASNQFGVDNGTLVNGCSLTSGKIGQAFTFDGVNDYVEFPNNSLNFNNDFSVSFWIYNNNMATNQNRRYIACSYYSSGTYGYGWQFARWGDGKYVFYCFNGDGGLNSIYMTTEDIIPVNQWTHITITRKWSTETRIYVNGVYKNFTYSTGNATINPGYSSTMYCTIGALKDNPSNISSYINGRIDGLNVWQRELTQAEVTELYNSGNGKQLTIDTKIVTSGLVLNLDASRKSSYPNSGTTWFDISGNGYNGTMVNGVTYSTTSSGVMNFDGINDYVSVSNFSTLTSYTIESWFKINYSSSATYARIIEKGLNNEFTLCINKGWGGAVNKYTFQLFDSSVAVQSTSNVDSNRYNHICVSVERTSGTTNVCKIYVNGVLENTASISGSITSNTNPIYIGNNPGAINVCGLLGEIPSIRMYNRALTDTEITQNFNATKSRFGL